MVDLPIDFEKLVREPKGKTASDYPYALKAEDLMKNFVFAGLDADKTLIEETTGKGGHKARKLKIPEVPSGGDPVQLTAEGGSLSWSAATSGIPEPPSSGFFVLASIDGTVQWVETEACD
jgi:hypothetical protein